MSFFEAILHNDLSTVQKYVEDGTDINFFIPDDEPPYHPSWMWLNTPLTLAIARGYFEIVEYLIKAGANIEQKGNHTPLEVAAVIHNQPRCLSLILKNDVVTRLSQRVYGDALLLAIARADEQHDARGRYFTLNEPSLDSEMDFTEIYSYDLINNLDLIKMLVKHCDMKGIPITTDHVFVLQAREQIQEEQSALEYETTKEILFQYSSAFEFSEIDEILKTYIGVKLG